MRKAISCVPRIMAFCMILLLTLSLCACEPIEIDIHIFADMDECLSIENIKADEAKVEIFDPAEKDKYLDDLEAEESFGCKYVADDVRFTLYAYVFTDSDHSMEYYVNATGKKSDRNPTFTSSSGMGIFSRVVISENKAYTVWCSKSDSESVIEFLNSRFSEEVYSTNG